MRRYQEFCPLARALDVIGDRWSLLIVRELDVRPCRYTDLRTGLPGIASNLLAERLRELSEAGVVAAEAAPPPVATTLYSLTDRGQALRPVIHALAAWGHPLLASGRGQDHFRSHWLASAAAAVYGRAELAGLEALSVLIDTGHGQPTLLRIDATGVSADTAPTGPDADLVLATDPETTVGLLTGAIHPEALAADARHQLRGSDDARRRFTALTDRARTARAAPAG